MQPKSLRHTSPGGAAGSANFRIPSGRALTGCRPLRRALKHRHVHTATNTATHLSALSQAAAPNRALQIQARAWRAKKGALLCFQQGAANPPTNRSVRMLRHKMATYSIPEQGRKQVEDAISHCASQHLYDPKHRWYSWSRRPAHQHCAQTCQPPNEAARCTIHTVHYKLSRCRPYKESLSCH